MTGQGEAKPAISPRHMTRAVPEAVPGIILRAGWAYAAPTLAEAETGILEHMNQEDRDVVQLHARRLLGRDGDGWIDDRDRPQVLRSSPGSSHRPVQFDQPLADPETARAALARLAKRAPNRLAGAT